MGNAGRWARWKAELELKVIVCRKEQCKGPFGTRYRAWQGGKGTAGFWLVPSHLDLEEFLQTSVLNSAAQDVSR